jgi:flagellar biosynthetic protein FliR
MISLEFRDSELLVMLLVLARCSGIFVFTPFLGSINIPAHVRIVLSFAVSYLFALGLELPTIHPEWSLTYILLGVGQELLIGMVIGFAAQTFFAGLQFAGQMIGFQIGLSLVNTIDPHSSARSTSLSVYQNYLGMMLFLGLNGHHWMLRAIHTSLTTVPPYSIRLNVQLLQKLTTMTAQLFVIGFQVAAPITAALLLTDFVLGVIGRSAPQIQILVIGFPLKVLVGLSALGLGLYFFPAAMRVHFMQLHNDLDVLIHSMRR